MSIDAAALETIVKSVWQSMTPLPIERLESSRAEGGTVDIVGWVAISGEWDGVVTLRAHEELARRVAAHMFGPDAGGSEEDVADAWGELANMVGGWVKAQAQGQGILSLPTVIRGTQLLVPDGRLAALCEFDVDGGALWVRVIERGSTVRRARAPSP